MKDEIIYIESIQENIELIFEFIKGISKEQYLDDIKTKMAVERSLENIWEWVKHLSAEIKKDISKELPWKEMAWMRDILVHDYLYVDDDIVWDVIINKLPEINTVLVEYINNLK